MTTTVAAHAASHSSVRPTPAARATFLGVLRGELFKLMRQRLNWFLALGFTFITLVPYLYAMFLVDHDVTLNALQHSPPQLILYYGMGYTLALQRVFAGIVLLIATARMVGLEYQEGTLQVLLARGVGRLQLLGAKLVAMSLTALGLIAWGILLNALGFSLVVRAIAGNLDLFNALTDTLWQDAGIGVLVVLVSMGVSILLATAVTVVTRSLPFGLAAALVWFAADNVAVLLMSIVYRFTSNDVWLKASAYLLGPELNVMPSTVVLALTVTATTPQGEVVTKTIPTATLGVTPLVGYDGTHALVVALVYGVIFAAAAALVMWRRDVLD
jgi:ABC-type transport system involved in multi-copper enzyme maturation permease subunit